MRTSFKFSIDSADEFKKKLLIWSQQFSHCVWLDSNGHKSKFTRHDGILAVGVQSSVTSEAPYAFDHLEDYLENLNDWAFGFLTYDLKNCTEELYSRNFDALGFPELYFFQPEKLFLIKGDEIEIQYVNSYGDQIEKDLKMIQATGIMQVEDHTPPKIKMRIHKDAYFSKVEDLLHHIHRGDIYEANFCQEFYAEDIDLQPLETYWHLNGISQSPFSTFLRIEDKYLICASPERFLRKENNTIVSQPIKGTARRSKLVHEDEALKEALRTDEKERSENIMIVDLVRNDLSQTAKPGSVKVTELCEVYSFLQVHQMISTVESELQEGLSSIEAIKQAFPMGSMTGAPKISAMKIIEELEETKRGLYSGSVGFFKPNGDFDFNVVIRSILYNASARYASFSVGSAITAKSNPHNEYEECLLKAKAMREVLEN